MFSHLIELIFIASLHVYFVQLPWAVITFKSLNKYLFRPSKNVKCQLYIFFCPEMDHSLKNNATIDIIIKRLYFLWGPIECNVINFATTSILIFKSQLLWNLYFWHYLVDADRMFFKTLFWSLNNYFVKVSKFTMVIFLLRIVYYSRLV